MNDPVAAIVLWFAMCLAASIVIPILVALLIIYWVLIVVSSVCSYGYGLVRRRPLERKLTLIIRERDDAIRDILRLRNEGEHELRRIVREQPIVLPTNGWR